MMAEYRAAHRHGGRMLRSGCIEPSEGAGRRVITGLAAVTAAGLLAACGSASGSSGSNAGQQPNASQSSVVSARKLTGVGTALVNHAGKTVYTPDQEAHGKIMCTGGCLSFWIPVTVVSGGAVPAPSGVAGRFETIHRADDGLTQLTYNGKPLYTFRLDQRPGQVQGNGFADQFGGVSFTWHVVTTSGAAAGTAGSGNPGGGYSYPGGSSGY
jgi:predicted lipoprotein with Yx(FWY)xxD motif